jgi:hypothetical protein
MKQKPQTTLPDSLEESLYETIDQTVQNKLNNVKTAKEVNFEELEAELDKLFISLDIDVEFTKHFKERVIERGLSEEDIMELMRKVYDRHGDEIDGLKGGESRVFTDLTNLVDIVGSMSGYGEDYLRDLNLLTAYKSVKDERLKPYRGSPRLTVKEEMSTEPFDRVEYYLTYFRNLAPSTFTVERDGGIIRISNITEERSAEVHPQRDEMLQAIQEILEYMLDLQMNILPLPEIKFINDEENSKNLLGNTAHYNPDRKELVLYTCKRHGKDILRSFCHEMIHHIQNLEDRLHRIHTTNINQDDQLADLEKEAYLNGNMVFRSWENSKKNQE